MSGQVTTVNAASTFEIRFGRFSRRFVRAAPWPFIAIAAVVLPVFMDRLADAVTGSVVARALCDATAIFTVWRYYVTHVARLVLNDATLELTCTKDVISYPLREITAIKLWSVPSNGFTMIRIKTRDRWWRRRYRAYPPQGSLAFEKLFLEQCQARGLNAYSGTRVLWR